MATSKPESEAEPKRPFHEIVAEKLIQQLQAGTAPWQKPWEPGQPNGYLPMNPTTGKRYRGINAMHLMAQSRSDARWMTFKQAVALGAQVRKGEKGTPVQYWKFPDARGKEDDNGQPVVDTPEQPVKESARLQRPRVFFATVFNAEQIDGLPELQPRTEHEWDPVERAERILQTSGATITHAAGDRAFYRVHADTITMPERGQFQSADRYYATVMHELGHWTGHPSRLNRDLANPFGSEAYAKEELRAEIASLIVGDELGLGHDPGQHAAYVGHWIKVLRDEPLEVFRAAADAEKIFAFVMAFDKELAQKKEQAEVLRLDQLADLPPADLEVVLGIKQAAARLVDLSYQAVDVELPIDWSGELRIVSVAEQAGGEQLFGVYARKANAVFGEDAFAAVGKPCTSVQAEALAERLYLVDAFATENQQDCWVKFARIQEERLRRDPNATDESRSWAKEVRKNAEATAMSNAAKAARGTGDLESEKSERQYINVPYKEKNEAKSLGARWDRQQQSWYVPSEVDVTPFAKWVQEGIAAAVEPSTDQPVSPPQDTAAPPAQQERQASRRNIGGSVLPSNDARILRPVETRHGALQVRVMCEGDTHGLFRVADDVLLAMHPNGYSCHNLAERIRDGGEAAAQAVYIVACGGVVTEAGRSLVTAVEADRAEQIKSTAGTLGPVDAAKLNIRASDRSTTDALPGPAATVTSMRAAIAQLVRSTPDDLILTVGHLVVTSDQPHLRATPEAQEEPDALAMYSVAAIADAHPRAQAWYDPATNITVFLADRIEAGREADVFLREVVRRHGRQALPEGRWGALVDQLKGWARAEPSSPDRGIHDAAAARVATAGVRPAQRDEALFAYAVEEAAVTGVEPSAAASSGSAEAWLHLVVDSIQQIGEKLIGNDLTDLGGQDLVDLTYALAQRESPVQRVAARRTLEDRFEALQDWPSPAAQHQHHFALDTDPGGPSP